MSTRKVKFSSEKLKEIRKTNGVSSEKLAQALGVSRPTISHWERGKSDPTPENLVLISKYFNLHVSEFQESEENHEVKRGEISKKTLSILRMVAVHQDESLDSLLEKIAKALAKTVLQDSKVSDPDLIEDAKRILK
ncbi:MAG: helix-turn-helix transcriptional regulator [Planctomycetaceae bacterium]|nr:helix-turn-helix transcriptional regulator [Planctomycetaceae bacterium]